MSFDRERLMQLLPAIYRVRDEEGDGTLAALLGILAEQAEVLGEDLAQLYDDQFIETCAEWVVPYIADLVGARGIVSVKAAAFSARAFVANTIRYRRRKGTIAVVEQLARDVTGWPASAVEYFLKLITTQNVNHIRLTPHATVDLRDWRAIERLDSPFETSAHTAEVRRIHHGRGKYNIPNIGIFLWRINAYPLTASPAVEVDDRHFLIHPLGIDSPLVTLPETETEIEQLAQPLNVPLPISRRALDADLASFYGADRSIRIHDGANAIPIGQVHVCDLSDGSSSWTGAPAEPVAIDPVLGRLAFAAPPAGPVATTFHYGFPADLGGGEYEREVSFAFGDTNVRRVPNDHATITAALTALGSASGVIEITDSGRYEETLAVTLAARQRIELRADNGKRPTLILGGDLAITGGVESQLHLNGLLIAGGALHVPDGDLALLRVVHCTLVPGQTLARDGSPLHPELPSILADAPNDALTIEIERSITGALHVSPLAVDLKAVDSIIDGGPPRTSMAVVSGKLTSPVNLTEATPSIDVTVGNRGPVTITLAQDSYTVAEVRNALQDALRTEFGQALVLTDSALGFLVVLSGTSEEIALAPHGADTTLASLKLDEANRRVVRPFVSDRLPDPIAFTQQPAALTVRIGNDAPHEISVANGTVVQVRNQLAAAIPAAAATDAYTKALVVSSDRRLIVVPGVENADAVFGPAALDATTFRQLGLAPSRDAIRGDVAGSDAPPLSLTRCTILGTTRATSLPFVTDTIFAAPVVARRKQTGCVRFSFVPEGSRTPRRYRCQPDFEVAEEIARQRKRKLFLTDAQKELIRKQIAQWLVPGFVSTQYGDATYAQLTRSTPWQIRTGAEDGSEMGVYAMLQQPQREANLRAALDEYLRFGLEAGVFYAS